MALTLPPPLRPWLASYHAVCTLNSWMTSGLCRSEKLIGVAVKFAGAGLQNGVDVAAAVAALAGVVQRGLHLELLDDVGIGERDVSGLRDVVIGGADALDQIVVIVLALAVHDDADVAAAELRGSVEFALRAGGKREQLLIILGGEGQLANG